MSGRWLTIERAFARVVEIEGTPEIAFPTFCTALHSGTVDVTATRRHLLFQYEEERCQDDRIDRFQINDRFWQTICFTLKNGIFGLDGYLGESEIFFIDNKDYDPFILQDWSLAVLQSSLEACLSDQPRKSPPVQKLVKRGGGAPCKYDWAGAGAAIAAYVVDNDYPEDQGVLREYVKAWFGTKNLSPDSRDVVRFVDQAYQEGRRLKENRKTSFPSFPRYRSDSR